MTIASTTVQTSGSTGNGVTTVFSFSFNLDPNGYGSTTAASQVQVIKETIATGAKTTLTLTTDYTVSVNADQTTSPGGSITMVSAPSSAYKIWIRLNPDFTQQTDYQNQGGFLMETVEDQADQQARQILWLKDAIRRAPRVDIGAGTAFDGEISGALTAGYVPMINGGKTGWTLGTPAAGVTASTAMAAVMAASTTASGRTLLGVGGTINVTDPIWGWVGDGVDGTTGVATATSATFTDTNASWTSADVGKAIAIKGAGTAGAVHVTTIASRNSATSIQLTVAAVTTVASNAIYQYGTDNTTVMATLSAYLAALSATGARQNVVCPSGKYLYTTCPTWAITGLRFYFMGDVCLRCIGTGNCFIIDAGASGYAWDVCIFGWPKIEGHANTGHGVYIRSAQHDTLQINVRGCGGRAWSIEFAVLCDFDKPIVSNNENAGGAGWFWSAQPTHGMYFTRRGSGSEKCGHNYISCPIIEGLPIGVCDDYATGNIFDGGAIEGCTTAISLTANSTGVNFHNTDVEANTTDVSDAGATSPSLDLYAADIARRRTNARLARGYLSGLGLTNGTDATNDVDIAAGECRDYANSTDLVLSSALTKQTDATWAVGTGAGGLDGGTVGNGTYHLFLIMKNSSSVCDAIFSLSHGDAATATMTIASPAVVTMTGHGLVAGSPIVFTTTGALPTGVTAGTQYYVISTSLTADTFQFAATIGGTAINSSGSQSGVHTCTPSPVMPSGYTKYRRIGSIVRSGGSIRAFTQNGDEFLWSVPQFDFGGGVGEPTDDTAVSRTLSVPVGVKVDALWYFTVTDTTPAAATYCLLSSLDTTDTQPAAALSQCSLAAAGATAPAANSVACVTRTNRAAQVRTRVRGSTADHTIYAATLGWRDARGRFV